VIAWGTGTPRREFLHVTDLADAIVLLLERYDAQSLINVGCARTSHKRALRNRHGGQPDIADDWNSMPANRMGWRGSCWT